MPITRFGATIGSIPATPEPTSVACTANCWYPRRFINSANCCATPNRLPAPGAVTGVENPYPGNEGITTWNAVAGSSPCALGSVSGPIVFLNSNGELGQP